MTVTEQKHTKNNMNVTEQKYNQNNMNVTENNTPKTTWCDLKQHTKNNMMWLKTTQQKQHECD